MAFVRKLEIQGIRSVGPNDSEKVTVRFDRPFTIITGENGAGKTTIVEALKYSAAGSEPPGAKVGGWIHHPKVLPKEKSKPGAKRARAKQVGEVLAQIQCEFEFVDDNHKRKRLVAKRCLKGTIDIAKNKMTKSTLDGTIQLRNYESGVKELEQSHKVLDMNANMNKYLKIPKPILEYVIFCHQEDTLWPFDEGKALKEKFDDIFQSAEFVNVLDQIRKDRKTTAQELKIDEVEKKRLWCNFQNAQDKRKQIIRIDDEIVGCDDQIERLSETITPIEEKYAETADNLQKVYFHNESFKQVSARKTELKNDLIELKGKDPNIQSRAESCDMNAETVQLEIEKCQTGSKRKEIESQIEREVENHKHATDNLDNIKAKITKLRNDHETFDEDFTLMKNVCEKAMERTKCSDFNDFTLEEHRKGIRAKCEEKKQEFVQKENTANENLQKDLNDLNTEINSFSEAKAGLKAEFKSITDRINEKENERVKLVEKRDNMSQATSKLNKLRKTESEKSDEINELNAEERLVSLESSIKKMKCDRDSIIDQIEDFESNEDDSRKKKELTSLMDDKMKDLKLAKDTQNENQAKVDVFLSDIPGYIEGSALTFDELSEFKRTYTAKERKANEKQESANKKYMTKAADITSASRELGKIRKELQSIRNTIQTIRDDSMDDSINDLDEEKQNLSDLEEKLANEEEEMAAMKEGKKLYQKFLKDLKNEACCPLCKDKVSDSKRTKLRILLETKMEFSNYDSVLAEISDLKNKIVMAKKSIKQQEDEKECEKREEDQKTTLKEFQESQKTLKEDLDRAQKDHKKMKDLKEKVFSAEPYVRIVSSNSNKIKALEKRVSTLQNDLVEVKDAEDYSILSIKLGQLRQDRKEIETVLDSNEKERSKIETKHRQINNEREQLRSQISELAATVNDGDEGIMVKIDTLVKEIDEFKSSQSPIQNQISEIDQELESKRDEINDVQQHYRGIFNKLREKQGKAEKLATMVSQKTFEFAEKHGNKSEAEFEKMAQDLDEQEQDLAEKVDVITKKIDDIKEKRNELTTEASRLLDVKQYIEKYKQFEEKKGQASELKKKLQIGFNENTCLVQDLQEKKNDLEGEIQSIKDQIVTLRAQREEKLKSKVTWEESLEANGGNTGGLDREMKEKVVDCVIKKACIDDLDQIHGCLEDAIMNVHRNKMSRLNMIIRHLWKSTYQGHDIESISISCDSDGPTRTANTRRNYQYCVNMQRADGTVLPMRGRASAGQRVLASLIIRLSLAKCFTTCGILALDEPTTNLDRRNIRKFAETLKRLSDTDDVECQFIIITHDNEFVQELSGTAGVQTYYRVTKNDQGYSQAERRGVNTLQPASCTGASPDSPDT